MSRSIKKAVVLGSGTMGSSIAGLLAGAGLEVHLLDIPIYENGKPKNSLAMSAKKALPKARGVYNEDTLNQIFVGNFDDDLYQLETADWIIEVIVERMDIKLDFYKKIAPHIPSHTILSSNTSGLSINKISDVLPEEMRGRFLGVHFFNPPRYMKLVEIIPSRETRDETTEFIKDFIQSRLGKNIVIAEDTPNFIANRIGCFSTVDTMNRAEKYGIDFGQTDSYCGTAIGRSPSGIYRTTDIVGLDTTKIILEALATAVPPDEENLFKVPGIIGTLVNAGHFGDKTKSGFFKRVSKPERKILIWDETSSDYIDYNKKLDSWFSDMQKKATPAEIVWAARDIKLGSGRLVWESVKEIFLYSAKLVGEITKDFRSIDLAMQWGYNWVVGPFALLDSMGAEKAVAAYREEGAIIPDWIEERLAQNGGTLYEKSMDIRDLLPKMIRVNDSDNKVVVSNSSISLIDINDGVGLLAFHSKGNTVNSDITEALVDYLDQAESRFDALVIGNNGKNFSAGADLTNIYRIAKSKDASVLRNEVNTFQDMTLAIKYFGKPLVAAPFGMALGGGCEICMHSHRVLANIETYMGLVEVGVGLVPAGGGLKEMAIRVSESSKNGVIADKEKTLLRNWQNVAMGKVSTSGLDAIDLGLIPSDSLINMNLDTQIKEAKKLALALRVGFRPHLHGQKYSVSGTTGYAMLKAQTDYMLEGNWTTPYNVEIALKMAFAICGGDVPEGSLLTEKQLLELEREAFVELAMNEKTLARIEHMLKTGKPLIN